MKKILVGIYEGCYYTDENDYNEGCVDSNKYNYIVDKAINLIGPDLDDNESLNGLVFDNGIWEAEIWNSDTGNVHYRSIDQSIFKNI